jgi:general secretion pathway protein D
MTRLPGNGVKPAHSAYPPALLVAVLSLAIGTVGCATTGGLRAGQLAESVQDYDLAVVQYTKALRERPDDRELRQALGRAKLRGAQAHFTRGRRLAFAAKLDEAMVEYQLAGELNPASKEIADAGREARSQLRARVAVSREGKTRLETLIERSRTLAPEGLELPTNVTLPESLIFRDARARDVFTAIAKFANLSMVFDPDFRDQPVTVDLRNAGIGHALDAVAASTRTFYRVTAPRTVTIIPDTAAKRRDYEEEVVRTFYLSNADLKETIDLLRIVIDARRIAPVASTNAITIKDTPERVAAAARVISAIDKARPEVVIDVELLEVDRTRLKEYGLQLASPGSPGIDGQTGIQAEGLTLRDLRSITQADVFLTNLPSLFYRLLKTDSSTRTLANPQLRTTEGVAAQARFGERVPVPVTTFSPIATGGVPQQPITSYNYENIGVNIDITPRTHHDDEISLALRLAVTSISGTGFGGLPTFGNREINTTIRLRDGETNILAGLIRDDERNVLQGIPGLSDLPLIGRLFAHTRREAQETDIVLTLTPRLVRVLDLSEDDLRPFRMGSERDGAAALPLAAPPPAPAEQPPAAWTRPATPLLQPPPSQ